jgi:hypothetical protein
MIAPSSGKQADGWQNGERPPARFINWFQNLAHTWLLWLDQQEQASTAALGTLAAADAAEATARAAADTDILWKSKASREITALSEAAFTTVGSGRWSSFTCNGLGHLLACGDSGALAESTDGGVTWITCTSGSSFTGNYKQAAHGVGGSGAIYVVAGGTDIQSMLSTTGASAFTQRQTAGGSYQFRGVTFGNGTFVAIADDGSGNFKSFTSTDGVSWTSHTIAGTNAAPNGKLVSIGGPGTAAYAGLNSAGTLWTSPDGITWTSRTLSGAPGFTPTSIAFNSVQGYACFGTSTAGKALFRSTNGTTWTLVFDSSGSPGAQVLAGIGGVYAPSGDSLSGWIAQGTIKNFVDANFQWSGIPTWESIMSMSAGGNSFIALAGSPSGKIYRSHPYTLL